MKKIETYIQKTAKTRPELKNELELESRIFEIGYNISQLRQAKNYSQKEFANMLWVTQWAVSRIESGQNMKCETLWKISNVLWEDLEVFWANVRYEKEKVAAYFMPLKWKEIVGSTTNISWASNALKSFTFITSNTYEQYAGV